MICMGISESSTPSTMPCTQEGLNRLLDVNVEHLEECLAAYLLHQAVEKRILPFS